MDFQAIACAPRPARLGLDIGVLDEAGVEGGFGDGGAACERRRRVALPDPAVEQDVARLVRLHQRRVRCSRSCDAHDRRQRRIADRQVGIGHRLDRLARADQRDHGLAAKAHHAVREYRLILDVRIDAEAVARHVARAEHALYARMRGGESGEIAQLEGRVMVRRAHHAQPQGVGRDVIGAVALFAGELGHAVHLGARAPIAAPAAGEGASSAFAASSTASMIFW